MRRGRHPHSALAFAAFLLLADACRADALTPGDPKDLESLGITAAGWLLLLAAALAGLRWIRRSHDKLPPR